ncbi:Hypothetical protein ETEE_1085 [Edwardsiella anguillarum ET080813]|uniref:Uncharacterized protein n=1 Tax=Edwardsiella anguillarum ET080813 TaxID=667120 RepID=A0A076LLI1_9GAMM|nr:Hypothetical protein ETEE_1085 [Edwardsiella anguillarum ET080813]
MCERPNGNIEIIFLRYFYYFSIGLLNIISIYSINLIYFSSLF